MTWVRSSQPIMNSANIKGTLDGMNMDRDGEYARQSTCANSVFAIQLFKTGMRACVLYIVQCT
jgi:hypothetical protein